jgi:hypothetical protein
MAVDHLTACDLVVQRPERVKRKRGPRKPRIDKLIAEAEKTGRTVTSITTSDGTTLRFGDPAEPTEASNPWLADLDKVTKQ